MMDGPALPPAEQQRLIYLRKTLVRVRKHLLRKQEKQTEELRDAGRAAWYRQVADSLFSAMPPPPKGAVKTALFNIHTQKEETVALNPKLDFKENAALYYKKARKGARGLAVSEKKTKETGAELAACDQYISETDAALAADPGNEKVAELCGRIEAAFGSPVAPAYGSAAVAENEGEKIPYRRFTFDGWDIFVGKNDSQNDEMTVHFARPHDLWLHVAGHAGSHVLVRRPDRTTAVPDEVVRSAASLAVWFSKAKHTSYAEVHATEARFVRKRRHAPAGEVVVERCRSIRVAPKSPEDLFPSRYDDPSK